MHRSVATAHDVPSRRVPRRSRCHLQRNATYSLLHGGPLATCMTRSSRSMSTAPAVMVRLAAGSVGSGWRQIANGAPTWSLAAARMCSKDSTPRCGSSSVPHAFDAIERIGRDLLQQRLAVARRQEMVRMGDDAVAGKSRLAWSGLVSTSTIVPPASPMTKLAEQVRGVRRHRRRPLLEAFRVQHLPAAHVERFAIGIAAVVARCQPVLDQADAALVHAHLAARDPGLGQADEARTCPCAVLSAPRCARARPRASPSSGRARYGDRRSPRARGRMWCSRPARPAAVSSPPVLIASCPNRVKASS